jgi:hypothetical protein
MGISAFSAAPEVESPRPRYTAISKLYASYSLDGDEATCVADVLHSGAKVNVKIILQKSTNGGKSYSDLYTLLNKTYTKKLVAAEATKSGLDTNYTYRTKVTVTVYDSSGRTIDSGTVLCSLVWLI